MYGFAEQIQTLSRFCVSGIPGQHGWVFLAWGVCASESMTEAGRSTSQVPPLDPLEEASVLTAVCKKALDGAA